MKRIIIFLCLILFCTPAFTQINDAEVLSHFVEASEAYKNADYNRAISEYEAIRQGQKESGELYYNLGNTYFKKGELGKAILNYQRAQSIIPRDSDLKYNYRYVLNAAHLEEEMSSNVFQKAIRGHIEFYTKDEMALIIVGLLVALALGHLLSLYLKRSMIIRRWMLGLLAGVLIVYCVGLILKIDYDQNRAIMIIETDAKFEPREAGTTHFKLLQGASVKVVSEEDSWFKIKRTDGKLGWVEKARLEKI